METDDAVARFEFADAAADLDYRASQFVPENLRRRDKTVVNLLDVGSADAAGGDAKQNLSLADFGNGNAFDDDLALAAIDASAHQAALVESLTRSDLSGRVAH
jgi:hypothetical protein